MNYQFKVVLIGDSGVGKTSILRLYINEIFEAEGGTTVGVDFRSKSLQIGNNTVKVVLVLYTELTPSSFSFPGFSIIQFLIACSSTSQCF